jgi:hypothetical protein
MKNKVLTILAAVGFILSGTAQAVPCGWFGVAPSQQCQNGTGLIDSDTALNAGNYFGASNWTFLDRVNGIDDPNENVWDVRGASRGLPAGIITLADGLWSSYSVLAVSLQGAGGAYPIRAPASTPPVYWSLYQLVPDQLYYGWIYGATRSGYLQNVSNVTLYGIQATRVSEPGSLALVLLGITAITLAWRRRSVVTL